MSSSIKTTIYGHGGIPRKPVIMGGGEDVKKSNFETT